MNVWQLFHTCLREREREIKALDQRVSEEHACIFVLSCFAVSQGVGGVEGQGGYKTSMDLSLPFK